MRFANLLKGDPAYRDGLYVGFSICQLTKEQYADLASKGLIGGYNPVIVGSAVNVSQQSGGTTSTQQAEMNKQQLAKTIATPQALSAQQALDKASQKINTQTDTYGKSNLLTNPLSPIGGLGTYQTIQKAGQQAIGKVASFFAGASEFTSNKINQFLNKPKYLVEQDIKRQQVTRDLQAIDEELKKKILDVKSEVKKNII